MNVLVGGEVVEPLTELTTSRKKRKILAMYQIVKIAGLHFEIYHVRIDLKMGKECNIQPTSVGRGGVSCILEWLKV